MTHASEVSLSVPVPDAGGEAVIRFEGVRKSFGDNLVLDGVTFEIRRGLTTVVLGPSGSGKSVILKHMVGLLRPDEGSVWFDGERIDRLRERDLGRVRLQMGLLFQMGALFDSMTVEENVGFPLREHGRMSAEERSEKVRRALEMVSLRNVGSRLPSELSGGQRKRVALARAIVLEPRVVLYDEPTTGLDPIRADGINDLILKLKRALGVTGVVVTHDLVSARKVADRVIMLLDGKIVADGSFEQLVANPDPRVRRFLEGVSDEVEDP